MGYLMKDITENYMAFNFEQTHFQDTESNREDSIQTMILLISKQVHTSSHINHELGKLKIDAADLINGKLSP